MTEVPAVYGGFWRRAAALGVDAVILMALSGILMLLGLMGHLAAGGSVGGFAGALAGESAPFAQGYGQLSNLMFLVLYLSYFTFFIGYAGQTPGKMLLGLHVTRITGGALNYRQAAGRWLGYWLSAAVFGLGFWWVLFNRRRRGWHDFLAGSMVLHVPRERIVPLPPEEEEDRSLTDRLEDRPVNP
jgi:uncharacterized RDD family membrane protein YckC